MTTQLIDITTIRFPEIALQTRDAHKLRGYFGNLFKEHSPLLHNHWEDGNFRYRYPAVQYKVIDGAPMLVGVEEGAALLSQLFLKIKEINIDGKVYPVSAKNIEVSSHTVGFSDKLKTYQFQTLWMALNQANYHIYQQTKDAADRREMLNSILTGHILSFFRNMHIELKPAEKLLCQVDVHEKTTRFKDNAMIVFSGKFIVNALLPDWIGIGKSSARGFGTIVNG